MCFEISLKLIYLLWFKFWCDFCFLLSEIMIMNLRQRIIKIKLQTKEKFDNVSTAIYWLFIFYFLILLVKLIKAVQ